MSVIHENKDRNYSFPSPEPLGRSWSVSVIHENKDRNPVADLAPGAKMALCGLRA